MSRLRNTHAILALLLLGGTLFAQLPPISNEPSRSAAPDEERKGSIAGTTVSAKTGEILKGVNISLRRVRADGRNTKPPVADETVSGADGRFEFQQLPAGTYQLRASKVGFAGEPGFRPQARVDLAAGKARDDIVVRMQPSAVVTGHVFDAYGDPLSGAIVSAISRRVIPNRRTAWSAMQGAQTDDLGEYRLYDLPAGKYVLAAQARVENTPVGAAYVEFASTYYPGVPSREQATLVRLAYGAELTGVDFRLEHSAKTILRGAVVDDSSGKPCNNCSVAVMGDDDANLVVSAYPTEEGVFVIEGLQPGLHEVLVGEQSGNLPRNTHDEILIPPSGETEVVLSIGPGQIVSGEVVVESPPEHRESAQQTQDRDTQQDESESKRPIFVILEMTSGRYFAGGRTTVPAEGSAFEMPNIAAGEYFVRIQQSAGYLRSLTLNGRDLGGPTIRVSRDGPLSDIGIRIAFDGPTLSGVVKPGGEGATLNNDLSVIALPGDNSDSYAIPGSAPVEPGGAFTIKGLVPGSYTLFVVPSLYLDIEDPEIRRALEPYGKRITLRKNAAQSVELEAVPESVELW